MVATPSKSASEANSDETQSVKKSLQVVDSELIGEDWMVPPELIPDVSELVTEDDTPVDNFPSARQQRLLVGSLYSSLTDVEFLAEANVGIYPIPSHPPIVPDVFVSFGVERPEGWERKEDRCYFVWLFGKSPDIAIEIVSNKKGEELGSKLTRYAHMKVSYYAVYDPAAKLSEQPLQVFELRGHDYIALSNGWMESVNLGLTLWEGAFEGGTATWLRWCDQAGDVLKTGDELAQQEKERADRLAELLRAQGIDPDEV